MNIREGKGIVEYLEKRNILKQDKEAKKQFLKGNFKVIDSKPQKPK